MKCSQCVYRYPPGNKVIWDAPPLRGVMVPEKEIPGMSSDGHMHSH